MLAAARLRNRGLSPEPEPEPAWRTAAEDGAQSIGDDSRQLTLTADPANGGFGIDLDSACVVSKVRAGGAAARSGLPVGWQIVAVDGLPVDSKAGLIRELGHCGQTIVLSMRPPPADRAAAVLHHRSAGGGEVAQEAEEVAVEQRAVQLMQGSAGVPGPGAAGGFGASAQRQQLLLPTNSSWGAPSASSPPATDVRARLQHEKEQAVGREDFARAAELQAQLLAMDGGGGGGVSGVDVGSGGYNPASFSEAVSAAHQGLRGGYADSPELWRAGAPPPSTPPPRGVSGFEGHPDELAMSGAARAIQSAFRTRQAAERERLGREEAQRAQGAQRRAWELYHGRPERPSATRAARQRQRAWQLYHGDSAPPEQARRRRPVEPPGERGAAAARSTDKTSRPTDNIASRVTASLRAHAGPEPRLAQEDGGAGLAGRGGAHDAARAWGGRARRRVRGRGEADRAVREARGGAPSHDSAPRGRTQRGEHLVGAGDDGLSGGRCHRQRVWFVASVTACRDCDMPT